MSGEVRFKVRQRAVGSPCRCGSGVGIYIPEQLYYIIGILKKAVINFDFLEFSK